MVPVNTQDFLDRLTVQSDSSGEIKKLKKSFSTPEETLNLILGCPGKRSELSNWIKQFTVNCKFYKCQKLSESYRNKGNSLFVGPSPQLSLEYFTLAIKYAPESSCELRFAFGNRAATLLLMGEYEKCLQDIEYAICGENVLERQLRLLVRKAKCFYHLGKRGRALEVYQNVKNILGAIRECDVTERLRKLNIEVENNLKGSKLETHTSLSPSDIEDKITLLLPEVSYGVNSDFPYASAAIFLRDDPFKGRHVLTNKSIKMGDTLFVEKPFCFVLLPDSSSTHCHFCCLSTINPIPCKGCAEAIFCNENCRSEAWRMYHRWECGPGLDLCYSIGIAHLGLRLALVGKTHKDMHRYESVKNLVSHLEKLHASDLFQYALTAALLTTYLENHTDFFLVHSDCKPATIGGLILQHIAQMVCNGHAITDFIESADEGSDVYSQEQVRIATAIFPSASMMNHSCDSNIVNSFSGQHLIVRASRNIGEGEEVFNCYGPHFRRMSLKDRQKTLKEQYKFICDCEPCKNPLLREFQQRFTGYLCRKCQGPVLPSSERKYQHSCMDCNEIHSLEDIENLLTLANSACEAGDIAMIQQNIELGQRKYQDALNLRKKVLYRHHVSVRECKDKLGKCYAILGQYDKSFDLIENCINGNEEQFGECSSEVFYEILKLSDICYKLCESHLPPNQMRKVKKTMGLIEKAVVIADVLYGKSHKNFSEIMEKKYFFECLLNKA